MQDTKNELVVLFHHERAVSVLRVYDSTGKRLFEVWHDGNMNGVLWMQEHSRLVIQGLNAEEFWSKRGFENARAPRHPIVLFGITPRLNLLPGLIINTPDHVDGFEPDWYKALLPPEVTGGIQSLDFAAGQDGSGDSFEVSIELGSEVGFPGMTISADGVLLRHARPNNNYLALSDEEKRRFPKPDAFFLGPLPPRVDTDGE